MGRRREDAIDVACKAWARQRRLVLGLDEPVKASQYLGAIRSTLGRKRDLPTGARSTKPTGGEFPEVYTGDALQVHLAYLKMRPGMKAVLDVHYIARAPLEDKAEALSTSVSNYFTLVREAKGFVEGRLSV